MNEHIQGLIALDWDGGDKWGSAMSHFFGIADTLYGADSADIPMAWQYSPGVSAGEEGEDWPEAEYRHLLDDGDITTGDLVHAGNVLSRYTAILRTNGESY